MNANNKDHNQQYYPKKIFNNLAQGKKIYLVQSAQQIRQQNKKSLHGKLPCVLIHFSMNEKYNIFMRNYDFLALKGFNLPQMYYRNDQLNQVYVQYISNPSALTYTPTQCTQLLSILQSLHFCQQPQFLPEYYYKTTFLRLFPLFFESFVQFGLHYNMINEDFLKDSLRNIAQNVDEKGLRTYLYRDLNIANILCKQDKLLLIDYDFQSRGFYNLDIVYVLNDKFYFVSEGSRQTIKHHYFYNIMQSNQNPHFEKFKSISFDQFQKDFTLCSIFQCITWLMQMVHIYQQKKVCFQLNIIPLIAAIHRNIKTYSLKWLSTNPTQQKLWQECLLALGKNFISSYFSLQQIQQINPLPNKMIFLIHQDTSIDEVQIHKLTTQIIKPNSHVAKINCGWDLQNIKDGLKIMYQQCYQHDQQYKGFQKYYQMNFNQQDLLVTYLINQFSTITIKGLSNVLILTIHKKYQKVAQYLKSMFNTNQSDASVIIINTQVQQKQRMQLQVTPLTCQQLTSSQTQQFTGILLAAGNGSRLGYAHKALIQIGQQKLIQIWLTKLLSSGINLIIIAQQKKRHKATKTIVDKFIQNKDISIKYCLFEQPLGSGKTIIQCLKMVQTKKFMFVSCDLYTNLGLDILFNNFHNKQWQQTVFCVREVDRSGLYWRNSDGFIKQAQNLLSNQEQIVDRINFGGIAVFYKQSIFNQQIGLQKYQLAVIFNSLFQKVNVKTVFLNENLNQWIYNINNEQELNAAKKMIL